MIEEETTRLQELLKYMVETNNAYNQEALMFIINSKGKLVIYTTSNVLDMKNKVSLYNHNKVISPNDILTIESTNFIEYMSNEYYIKPKSKLIINNNALDNDFLGNKIHQIIVPQNNNNNLNFVNYYKPDIVNEDFLISPEQSSKEDRNKVFINSKAIQKSNCFKCVKKKDQVKAQKEKQFLKNKRVKVETNMENEYIIKKEVFEQNENSILEGNNLDKSFIYDNYNNNIISDKEKKNDCKTKFLSNLEHNKELVNEVNTTPHVESGIIDSANNTISTIPLPQVITKSTTNTVFDMLKSIKSLSKNQTNELKQSLNPKLKILDDSFVNSKKNDLNHSKNVLLKVYDKLKQNNVNKKDDTCLSDISNNTYIDNLANFKSQNQADVSPIKDESAPRKQTIEENLVPKKLLNHSKFGGNNNQMATGGIFTKNSNVFLYQVQSSSNNDLDSSKC
jgi:hypothetical protein